MDTREPDPADFELHGEVGDLLPAQFRAARPIPWEEAVEWTFAPMTYPDRRRHQMSNVTCSPHTLPANAGLTGLCRTCGAEVTNAANLQAQSAGMVRPGGVPRTVNQHNSNPTRRLDK